MTIVMNVHAAKTNLSQLLEKAVEGENVVIAKAGKPIVRLEVLGDAVALPPSRIGFLAGMGAIIPPADVFNHLGAGEISELFGLSE